MDLWIKIINLSVQSLGLHDVYVVGSNEFQVKMISTFFDLYFPLFQNK